MTVWIKIVCRAEGKTLPGSFRSPSGIMRLHHLIVLTLEKHVPQFLMKNEIHIKHNKSNRAGQSECFVYTVNCVRTLFF